MRENRFVLSLGSNTSERRENVVAAIRYLKEVFTVSSVSSVYETLPWGGGVSMYANCVLSGATQMELDAVLALAKEWERKNGRDEIAKKCGIVPVDVDVVIWNDEVLRPKELEREYFMIGYRQIIPEPIHG